MKRSTRIGLSILVVTAVIFVCITTSIFFDKSLHDHDLAIVMSFLTGLLYGGLGALGVLAVMEWP